MIRAGRDGEPLRQVFRYRYDALGRRIAKEDDFGQTRFVWEGLRLLQESRGAQTSTYVYEPASYRPLARIDGAGPLEPEHPVAVLALAGEDPRGDPAMGKVRSIPVTNADASDAHNAVAAPVGVTARWLAELETRERGTRRAEQEPEPQVNSGPPTHDSSQASARIYYFHLQPNGLPEEMSNRDGHLVWRAQYRVWGSAVTEEWQAFDAAGRPLDAPMAETGIRMQAGAAPMPQNLRMQGQYLDRETGLHYNTFRYYDGDIGQFINQDPIGLRGGVNLYQYATNPLSWIDPLGLSCSFDTKANRWRNNETGQFTTRPVSPSELVNNGRANYNDIVKWAQDGNLPNNWVPNNQKFPTGGFKYQDGAYSAHGHGVNPSAVANFPGSNAATGPTVSIKGPNGNFRTDGTWGSFGSNPNGAHIPLDGSQF